MRDNDGEWKEDAKEIQDIVLDYFEKLFKATSNAEVLSERETVSHVTEEQNRYLIQPIEPEEVKEAIFSMHPEKSPGEDGLNPAFYQTYWSIVCKDVVKFCADFFATGEMQSEVNRTVVCLNPNIKNPQSMTDLRPISLCNVLFRILSKVMANRLKCCLSNLISINQSTFVEGRLLTDNALVAFEVNHYIRRKTQGKYGCASLKIDVSKAYDRLEWQFVENMLNTFGFHHIWIDRVMTCIRTVTYSFLQQGKVFGEVKPARGIRQGDPISPYLYILCDEGLSSIIRGNEEIGLIHGCKIANEAPRVSHLLFADDCYLFFKSTTSEAMVSKNVLKRYEAVSRNAINFNKSSITFSPDTEMEVKRRICEVLEVDAVDTPGRYLGIPMVVGRKKNEVFGFLTDKVKHKL